MIFDLERLDPRESYRLLVSTVVPRPIALVTTMDPHGVVNAAPFSFFNVMGHEPPIVVLGIERDAPGQTKDTARNISEGREFVVNLVNEAIAERMNICAVPFPAEVDELEQAGLTPAPSQKLAVPRILESPVSLECREMMSIGLGEGRVIAIGEVVALHLADEYYDEDKRRVRTEVLRLIGRMHGGDWYVRTTDLFQMKRVEMDDIGPAPAPAEPPHD